MSIQSWMSATTPLLVVGCMTWPSQRSSRRRLLNFSPRLVVCWSLRPLGDGTYPTFSAKNAASQMAVLPAFIYMQPSSFFNQFLWNICQSLTRICWITTVHSSMAQSPNEYLRYHFLGGSRYVYKICNMKNAFEIHYQKLPLALCCKRPTGKTQNKQSSPQGSLEWNGITQKLKVSLIRCHI